MHCILFKEMPVKRANIHGHVSLRLAKGLLDFAKLSRYTKSENEIGTT